MSNYHVLESSNKQNYVKAIFHIAVPDEDNSAGVNLQTAIAQWKSEQVEVTDVPWLQVDFATEYTAIQNGEIYELSETVEFDANLSVVQKRGEIDDRYTALFTNVPDIIRNRFQFWGLNRDVT